MADHPSTQPDSPSRALFAWMLYDFANSGFTTLVVTFIYATYFTQAIAPDEVSGTQLWSVGITVSALVVALLSPFLGVMADVGGYRKRFLLVSTLVCVLGSIVLYFPSPGQVQFALWTFVVANIAFEIANVFYNAYLPTLAPLPQIGRVSGYGWALGYVGGLACLVIGFFLLVKPEPPWFGLSAATGTNVRATNLLVAGWFALFSLPLFIWVQDRVSSHRPSMLQLMRAAGPELKQTFNHIRRYRQVCRLLLARLIYNDGLITIFAFGGIFAAGTFGFNTAEIFYFGIALNIAAGAGAYVFGFVDDRLGGKITILFSLAGLIAAAILAVTTQSRMGFWVAAIGVGLLAGPNQAASRSLLGRFAPAHHENEFFGFFAFSGKFTAFLGPLLLGQLTVMFNSQRAGIAIVIVFFLVGGLLLLRVNEQEGVAARRTDTVTGPQ
jgi:UMF1 family MFS transporter